MAPVEAIDVCCLASVCGGGAPAMSYSMVGEHYDLNHMQPGNYVLNSGEDSPVDSAAGRMGSAAFGGLRPGLATCQYGVDWVARGQTPLGPVTITRCNSAPD